MLKKLHPNRASVSQSDRRKLQLAADFSHWLKRHGVAGQSGSQTHRQIFAVPQKIQFLAFGSMIHRQ